MVRLALALLFVAPAAAEIDAGHSGVVAVRTGPEWSDMALFAMAAAGIWLVRRGLRRRHRRDGTDRTD